MQKVVGAYIDTFSMSVLCRGTRTQPGLQATAVLGSMHPFTQKLKKKNRDSANSVPSSGHGWLKSDGFIHSSIRCIVKGTKHPTLKIRCSSPSSAPQLRPHKQKISHKQTNKKAHKSSNFEHHKQTLITLHNWMIFVFVWEVRTVLLNWDFLMYMKWEKNEKTT